MRTILALLVLAAAPLGAQTVDPGMSREQVVERLGKPIGERATGSYIYLFYRNGCEQRCGMSDVVILENDAVVDAIFRSARHFSGSSTSPAGVTPEPTRTVSTGVSIEPSASAPATAPATAPAMTPAMTPAATEGMQPSSEAPARGGLIFSNDAKASAAAQPVAPPGSKRIMRVNASSAAGTAPARGNAGTAASPQIMRVNSGTVTGAPPASNTPADTMRPSGVSLTPGVSTPRMPPVPKPDSTSLPILPSVPDQKTGVSASQVRPSPLDSARLERQRKQRAAEDTTRKP